MAIEQFATPIIGLAIGAVLYLPPVHAAGGRARATVVILVMRDGAL